MDIKSTFANRLKKLRVEKGLSQEDFGKEIGVSRGSISYYEKEERVPDIVVLAAVSKYFNVSTDYLLGISEHKNTEELKPCPFCGGEAMSRSEALKLIYNIIKEMYSGCVRVNITVNSGGISCEVTEKPFTIGSSMRTINGDFLPQKETEE